MKDNRAWIGPLQDAEQLQEADGAIRLSWALCGPPSGELDMAGESSGGLHVDKLKNN